MKAFSLRVKQLVPDAKVIVFGSQVSGKPTNIVILMCVISNTWGADYRGYRGVLTIAHEFPCLWMLFRILLGGLRPYYDVSRQRSSDHGDTCCISAGQHIPEYHDDSRTLPPVPRRVPTGSRYNPRLLSPMPGLSFPTRSRSLRTYRMKDVLITWAEVAPWGRKVVIQSCCFMVRHQERRVFP